MKKKLEKPRTFRKIGLELLVPTEKLAFTLARNMLVIPANDQEQVDYEEDQERVRELFRFMRAKYPSPPPVDEWQDLLKIFADCETRMEKARELYERHSRVGLRMPKGQGGKLQ